MIIKATFWDFNGVVIADSRACWEGDLAVVERFGGKPYSYAEFQRTLIIPALNYYADHGCDRREMVRRRKELGEVFHGYYEPRASKCRTRRGVRETLAFLAAHRIPAVIFSNHTQSGIQSQLDRLRLNGMFTTLLANTDKTSSAFTATKGDRVRRYLKASCHNPQEVLIIGDSPEEVEIGQKLGLVTVAIKYGEYATSRLRQAKPDYLIGKVSDLIGIIKRR